MIRGTTPTLSFTLPFTAEYITRLSIVFAQGGDIVLEKSLDDCRIEENSITLRLSEEDTLAFSSKKKYTEIQLRVGIEDERLASEIIVADVERIIKDGCL